MPITTPFPTPTPLDLSAVDPCDLTTNATTCKAARKAAEFAAWNPWWILPLCILLLSLSLLQCLSLYVFHEHRRRRIEVWLYRRATRRVMVWVIGNDGEGDVGRTWAERLGFKGWRAFLGRRAREARVDESGGIELRAVRKRRGTSPRGWEGGGGSGGWHRLED